jgi:hypothetical protein
MNNTERSETAAPAVGFPVDFPVGRPAPERCEYCDGTGDVIGFDGEWRGYCVCDAGQALKAPTPGDHYCPLKRGGVVCRVCDLDTIAAGLKTPNVRVNLTTTAERNDDEH